MFDIGFWEVAFIGLLALLILGPSRLPEAARSAGQWIGKLRVFISNIKNDLDNQLQSDELAELRKLKNELVQAREVLQQTSGDMLSSFTDGVDSQMQEISGLPDSSDTSDAPEMDFIDDAVSAPRVSKSKKPKRKSSKTTVVKKGKSKKRPASKKTSTTNKKVASKKGSKKKTTGSKKTSSKKTSNTKRIAKAKSK